MPSDPRFACLLLTAGLLFWLRRSYESRHGRAALSEQLRPQQQPYCPQILERIILKKLT